MLLSDRFGSGVFKFNRKLNQTTVWFGISIFNFFEIKKLNRNQKNQNKLNFFRFQFSFVHPYS